MAISVLRVKQVPGGLALWYHVVDQSRRFLSLGRRRRGPFVFPEGAISKTSRGMPGIHLAPSSGGFCARVAHCRKLTYHNDLIDKHWYLRRRGGVLSRAWSRGVLR